MAGLCFAAAAAPRVSQRGAGGAGVCARRARVACAPRRARVRAVAPGPGPGPGRPGDATARRVADVVLRVGRFLQSTNGQIALWLGLAWLVITGRIGVLFDSFLVLFALVTVVPLAALVVARWWFARQVVAGVCPNCGADVTGLRAKPFQCMSCGQVIVGDADGNFTWGSDPSSATIDVDATPIDPRDGRP